MIDPETEYLMGPGEAGRLRWRSRQSIPPAAAVHRGLSLRYSAQGRDGTLPRKLLIRVKSRRQSPPSKSASR